MLVVFIVSADEQRQSKQTPLPEEEGEISTAWGDVRGKLSDSRIATPVNEPGVIG